MDMLHHILRGNRRFVMMKDENEMRGFVLELRRTNPTMNRNMTLAEVEGVDRFIADTIYIPEERQGLYLNPNEALKFTNGRILKDVERTVFSIENGSQ